MAHVVTKEHNPVTTSANQKFTCVGPFLRRWKIDELPQLFNVLMGHMSLVGPRPKMLEHSKELANLSCRPGITGAATLAFAAEEREMARIPHAILNDFYHDVVLPEKNRLDAEYMAKATFTSDVILLVNSLLRRWDNSVWRQIPDYESLSCRPQRPTVSPERLRSASEFYRLRSDRDLEEMAK
jgi:lipopolysaccharide/colanic/teichoic acid biosynthesis glycosyltransferase